MRVGNGIILVVSALALVACDHPTDPSSRFTVAINASTLGAPTIGQDPEGQRVLICGLALDATGAGSGTATWNDATFRLYFGTDRSSVVDSATIDGASIQQAWSAASIASGQTEHSQWHFSGEVPFSGDFEFHYTVDGTQTIKKVTVPVSCLLSATSAQAPTVGSVTTTPSTGKISTDSTLTVSYSASAPGGLWLTEVHVTGPCDVRQAFVEGLQNSVNHVAKIAFPSTCKLGVPITVNVIAMDGAAHQGSRTLQLPVTIADLEPPTIAPLFFTRLGGGAVSIPSGDYFAGDTVAFILNATDNHKLAVASWQVLPFGAKDSVVANAIGISQFINLVVQPAWTGSMQLAFQARDSVGLTSAVFTTPADSIRLHPTIQRPTQIGTINGATGELAIDSKRSRIYMLLRGSQQLAVVSTPSLQVLSTISVPGNADDIDITPQGDSLVLSFYGLPQLGIIDLRQPTLSITTLPIVGLDSSMHQTAQHLVVMANGHAMLGVSGDTPGAWQLFDVNLATGVGHVRADAAVNGVVGAVFMARSADGSVLAFDEEDARCLRRYAVATDAFSACVTGNVVDWTPAVDATGDRILIDENIYDASMQLLPQIGPDLTKNGVAFGAISADGQFFYEFFSYGIVRRKTADGTVVDRTPVPIGFNQTPRVSPDGNTLVVIDRENTFTKLALIDLR